MFKILANRPVMAANTPASNVAVTAAPNQQLQQFFQQYASAVPQNYFQQPMAMFPNALGLNYATGMPDFSSMFQQQAAVMPQFDVTGQPVFQTSSNLSCKIGRILVPGKTGEGGQTKI